MKFDRAVLGIIDVIDLRLGDREKVLILYGFVDLFGDEGLQHFVFDAIGKAAPNQRQGSFAGAKPRDPCHLREFPGHAFDGLLHFFGGNFEIKFAAASCFSHDPCVLSGWRSGANYGPLRPAMSRATLRVPTSL